MHENVVIRSFLSRFVRFLSLKKANMIRNCELSSKKNKGSNIRKCELSILFRQISEGA